MKDYRKIIFALVIVALLSLIVAAQVGTEIKEDKKPIVTLSTFSLYDIAKHISQDTFELVMIVPFGVDVHSYEPTPQKVVKIEKSALVVYSGAGLEPWTNSFNFKNRSIDMSNFVRLRELGEHEHEMHEHHDEQCVHNKIDPHYWLNFDNMAKATKLLTAEFIKIKPENENLYIRNRDSYLKMLDNLHILYKKELESCYLDTIIVNHNAFSYLSDRYGFNVEALSGLSPDKEITPKDMIRVMNEIKKYKVQTIFFESFVSDKAMKSLAKDANIIADTLQPLGNITKDEALNNLTYENIMKMNLVKISKALMCR